MKKEDIEKLEISPEKKTELFGLFDDFTKAQTEVSQLRTKSEDADRVIAKHEPLKAKLAEKETALASLQKKLDEFTTTPTPIAKTSDDEIDPVENGPFSQFGKMLD